MLHMYACHACVLIAEYILLVDASLILYRNIIIYIYAMALPTIALVMALVIWFDCLLGECLCLSWVCICMHQRNIHARVHAPKKYICMIESCRLCMNVCVHACLCHSCLPLPAQHNYCKFPIIAIVLSANAWSHPYSCLFLIFSDNVCSYMIASFTKIIIFI